ncbi:MAG: hypothetical protein RH862_09480 [Leptospiraceae bacterium]
MRSRIHIVAAVLLIQGLLLQLSGPVLGQHSHEGLQGSYVHFHDGILEKFASSRGHSAHLHSHTEHSHGHHAVKRSSDRTAPVANSWKAGCDAAIEPVPGQNAGPADHGSIPFFTFFTLFEQDALPAFQEADFRIKIPSHFGLLSYHPLDPGSGELISRPPNRFLTRGFSPSDIASGLIPFRIPPPRC